MLSFFIDKNFAGLAIFWRPMHHLASISWGLRGQQTTPQSHTLLGRTVRGYQTSQQHGKSVSVTYSVC